ncbi:MAG TPA: ComEC/Rec2 family competence protein [Tepidisphaeraceae bacterium]|jgi:competence protein ComEC|nr:ComEC/Rec2 family competence protein [Tepidisphaeraceae bacterium]
MSHLAEFFHRRPAVIFLLLLALGIGFLNLLPCKPWFWLSAAAGLSLIAIFIRHHILNLGLLSCAAFLVGLSAAQIEYFQFPSDDISNYTTDGERFAQLELAIDQPPRLVSPPPAELRSLLPKQTVIAEVRRIRTTGGWQSASGKIFLTIEHPNPRLGPGQLVRVSGMLQRPPGPMNPGEFDFAAWCRDQRILAAFRVGHADGVSILRDDGPSPLVWLREKSRHLLAMGFDAKQGFDHALLRAFVFGDSDPQLRDLEEKFVRTGTIHDLSISGLHVAIVGALALLICRLLRRSPRVSAAIALVVVLLYGSVALPSWPGWRSIILCTAATMGLLSRRSLDALQMFALAVAAVLLIHPADLRSGGFQVSVAAVLGMILFSGMAEKYFWAWWRGPDPPRNIPQRSLPTAILNAVWRFLVATALASFIAWGMSMPLIAYHFRQLNAWAVPAGVALLPLTVVALAAGVGKIGLTLLWPSAAHLWATVAVLPIVWMQHAINGLDRLPGASVVVPPVPIGLLIAYYAMFLLLLVPIRRAIWRWLARVASTAACAGLLLLPTVAKGLPPSSLAPRQPLRITLVSLGAGQCAIVRPTASHADLIDVGSSTISDVAGSLLLPWFRAEDCAYVDKIFLSHGDFDHISAAADIFNQFNEPPVYMSPHFARHAVGNIPAESLLETLQDAGHPPTIIHQGDHLNLGNGATIDVLWPPVVCDMNSNNCGLVLKLRFAGKTVLFPADIQEPPERELLKHPELLRADVLIAPHHGSAEITTAQFIAAVHPRIILASNYFKLSHKQKVFDVIAEDYPLYRTSRCGAIDVTIEPSGQIEVDTFLGVGPQEGLAARH